jgi:peptide/nickel transport system substrate-binding protein
LKPGAGGKRVTIKYLTPPYGEIYQRAAEFIRQSLGRVGIDVQIENTDVGGWAEKFSNWDYEMTGNLVYQFGDPALGVSRTYISSNIKKGILFSNTAGYSNPEVDRLFEEAATSTSEAKRQELYSQVQKILVEDVPVVWMFEQAYPTFIDKRLKNVTTTAIGVHESFSDVSFG